MRELLKAAPFAFHTCMKYITNMTPAKAIHGASLLGEIKFWGVATVGTKGQIVIPAEAREVLEIKENDKVIIFSPPDKRGLMVVKAEVLERTLQEMQTGISEALSSEKNKREG